MGNIIEDFGYTPRSDLKDVAEREGLSLQDVTVLAPQNDPFRIGTKTQIQMAEWFAHHWNNEGLGTGAHIRRLHYRLQSYGTVTTHKGDRYINDDHCSIYTGNASRFARLLNIVNPREFKDARNPEPQLYYDPWSYNEPQVEPAEDMTFQVFTPSLVMGYFGSIVNPKLLNYRYGIEDQPYLIEIWIEKSTMHQELIPICKRYSVNLVGGRGFQSHTSELALIDRCIRHNKSARILYISDFDPAGDNMPTAVARFLEFNKEQHNGLDIILEPILLTAEQVEHYNLPREPISEKKKRHHKFEDRHGIGATELDALAALHPGEFEKIVIQAIRRYRDPDIADEINDIAEEAESDLEEQWAEHMADIQEEADALEEETRSVCAEYRKSIYEGMGKLREALAPLKEKANDLTIKAREAVAEFQFDIPERPEASGDVEGNEIDHFYDSSRDFFDQLSYYQERKGT